MRAKKVEAPVTATTPSKASLATSFKKAKPVPAMPLPSPTAVGNASAQAFSPTSPAVRRATSLGSPDVLSPSAVTVSSWFVGEHRVCEGWVVDAPGPITTLRQEDKWMVPPPAPGEVRVRVNAVGLNPVDYIVAERKRPVYPYAPGLDVAGVIDVIGPEVEGFSAGDRVYYHGSMRSPYGGFGQYAITTTACLRHIPPDMDFETAAAIPCSAWTAHAMLQRTLTPFSDPSTRTVFITGGGGGVGSFAVQLASQTGAKVITSCGALNAQWVTRLGASENFNYRGVGEDGVLARVMHLTSGEGVDVWMDTAGPDSAKHGLRALRYNGVLVYNNEDLVLDAEDMDFIRKRSITVSQFHLNGVYGARKEAQQELRRHADAVEALVVGGELEVPITEFIDLKKLMTTMVRMKTRHLRGKTVLKRDTWTTAAETDTQQRNIEFDAPRTPSPRSVASLDSEDEGGEGGEPPAQFVPAVVLEAPGGEAAEAEDARRRAAQAVAGAASGQSALAAVLAEAVATGESEEDDPEEDQRPLARRQASK